MAMFNARKKRCNSCAKLLHHSHFGLNSSSEDLMQHQCIECSRANYHKGKSLASTKILEFTVYYYKKDQYIVAKSQEDYSRIHRCDLTPTTDAKTAYIKPPNTEAVTLGAESDAALNTKLQRLLTYFQDLS
jgi:hypothetical protein